MAEPNWWDEDRLDRPPPSAPTAGGDWWSNESITPRRARDPDAPEIAGAPFDVRLSVGTARERDRLPTLQQRYPDAKPHGDGNFVYTDPATGRRTLYNPPGLDIGDLPSVTREGAEMLGGGVGAVAGAPMGPGGMIAGGGLGTAAADQIVDLGRRVAGLPQSGGPGAQFADASKDMLSGAAGEASGQAMQVVPRAIAGALTRRGVPAAGQPSTREVADAADRLGVRPTVGMLASAPVAATEHMAANVLPASRAAREQGRFGREIVETADRAIPGQSMTPGEGAQAAGRALKEGAERTYGRFQQLRQRVDDQVYQAFPAGTTLPLGRTANVFTDLQARIAQAPETFGPQLQPVLQRMQAVMRDGARYGGRLPVQTFRNVRTLIGQELETRATTEMPAEAQRWLRQTYRALTDDLRSGAQSASPRAAYLLDRHDRLVRAFRGDADAPGVDTMADSMDKIIKSGSDEAAYSALMNGGQVRMRNALRNLDDTQRGVVARATWDRMLTTPQGNFNLNRMLGQWQKMDPAARQELFGRVADMGAIDDLMTVLGGMREGDRSRNFSNTGYTLIQAALGERLVGDVMRGIGAAAAGTGGVVAPTETAATALTSYLLSEALHNPAVARALADASRGRPVNMDEPLRRSLGRAVGQATGRDVLGEEQPR